MDFILFYGHRNPLSDSHYLPPMAEANSSTIFFSLMSLWWSQIMKSICSLYFFQFLIPASPNDCIFLFLFVLLSQERFQTQNLTNETLHVWRQWQRSESRFDPLVNYWLYSSYQCLSKEPGGNLKFVQFNLKRTVDEVAAVYSVFSRCRYCAKSSEYHWHPENDDPVIKNKLAVEIKAAWVQSGNHNHQHSFHLQLAKDFLILFILK